MATTQLPETRTAALRWYIDSQKSALENGGPVELRHWRRWLARNDLFFLLIDVLNRPDVNHHWLFDRCREVQAEPNGYLDLWGREHYKSTIITFGLTIQEILNDPEITVGFFSHTRPIAKGFLRQIKVELEQNDDLKALFPEVLWADPKREAPKWSEDDGIVVKRQGNPKESTVEAWGLVDGQPTAKHFKHRIYDDVVTRESVTTPEQIKKTTSAWELSDNLGVQGGVQRYAGTRYHLFDTYAEIEKRGVVKVRKHPATHDGTEGGEPVFMSAETLAEKRRTQGPYTYAAQMLLDPTADKAQGFRREWLCYWPCTRFGGLNLYMLVDPASKKKPDNDYTAIWIIGYGADGNYYVCDMVRDRLNLRERVTAVFALHRKWKPLKVGYEEYGIQADIEAVQWEQERTNYRFEIVALGGPLAKEDRIRRLVPVFEQGRFFLPEAGILYTDWEGNAVNLVRVFIEEEYLAFPVCAHDDLLDDASRILDEDLRATMAEEAPAHQPSRRDELGMQQRRDWQTA